MANALVWARGTTRTRVRQATSEWDTSDLLAQIRITTSTDAGEMVSGIAEGHMCQWDQRALLTSLQLFQSQRNCKCLKSTADWHLHWKHIHFDCFNVHH